MGILLIIGAVVVVGIAIAGWTWSARVPESQGAIAAAMLGSIFGGLMVVILGVTYISNVTTVKKAETFYTTNYQNYQATIDETRNLLSGESVGGTLMSGSVEKMEQGKAISERIGEMRDRVNRFNNAVAMNRTWCRTFWPLMPCLSNDVKPITISAVTLSGKR